MRNPRPRWAPLEFAKLRELYYSDDLPILERELGRSQRAIRNQAHRIGLTILSRCKRCGIDIPVPERRVARSKIERLCPKCFHDYREEKTSKLKQYHRRWLASKPDQLIKDLVRLNEWKELEPSHIRQIARERYAFNKLTIMQHYSPFLFCLRCGFSDYRALQLDHINGGGGKERRDFTSHGTFWSRILKRGFPDGYQVLCANCNWIKKAQNGEVNRINFLDPRTHTTRPMSTYKLREEMALG